MKCVCLLLFTCLQIFFAKVKLIFDNAKNNSENIVDASSPGRAAQIYALKQLHIIIAQANIGSLFTGTYRKQCATFTPTEVDGRSFIG